MKHIKHAIAAASMFVAFAAAADPVTQYLWWVEKTAPVWKNADGDVVTWTNGNDAVWKSVWNGNTGLGYTTYTMNSLTYDTDTYRMNFWLDGGYYKIGAGGLTFNQKGWFPVGKASATDRHLTITASQEWRGTQTGTARSAASIGYIGYATATTGYYHMRLGVENAVEWWKISGLLDVWIGCQNDQLGNVDVTVEAPARLILARSCKISGYMFYPDARLNAKKLTLKGDGFQLATDFADYPYSSTINELAVNTLDAAHLAPVLELMDGADISLTNGLFAIPSVAVKGSGTSEMVGSFSNNLASTSIAFSDGATLYLNAWISDGAEGPSAISATGSGTLKINSKTYSATGAVSLGADTTLCLAGNGKVSFPFSGGAAIELDIGAGVTNYLSDAELSGYVGTPVKVTSGTLIVQSHDSMTIPGLNLSADGGEIVYASDCPLIVTDIVRQEASITVGAGEELLVFGNGLTSATALSLTGGTVTFMRTATIASPISVSGAASQIVTHKNGICGTIAGAVTAEMSLVISGPGRMEFTAGATFSGDKSLYAYDGEVEIRSGNYAFGTGSIHVGTATAAATGGTWYGVWCRKFVVGDGANVTFTAHEGTSTYIHIKVYPLPDGVNYNREAVFEIATNGTVTLPNTSDISLGDNQNIGILHINGGTLNMSGYGRIRLGNGGYATGYLIMDSGTLHLGGYLIRTATTGMGYVIWNGGTIRVDYWTNDGGPYMLNAEGSLANTDSMRVSVNIAGDDCVLDLTGSRNAKFYNTRSKFNGMFNEWWGRGRLTVKGGKNFVMTSIPGDFRLRLEGDGTTVTFPANGKVYDYDTCLTNCQWRNPHGATKDYNVTNSWLSTMTFASLELAGTNCSFVCERDATPVYATNVTVAATGVTDIYDALPEGTVLQNVTFESGATWTPGSSVLDLTGVLTFGDSLRLSSAGLPQFLGSRKIAEAAGGVVGSPTLGVVGSRRNLRLATGATSASVYQAGTVMLFR